MVGRWPWTPGTCLLARSPSSCHVGQVPKTHKREQLGDHEFRFSGGWSLSKASSIFKKGEPPSAWATYPYLGGISNTCDDVLVRPLFLPIVLWNNPFIIKGEMFKFKLHRVNTPEESCLIVVTANDFSLGITSLPPHLVQTYMWKPWGSLSFPFWHPKSPFNNAMTTVFSWWPDWYYATQLLKTAHIWWIYPLKFIDDLLQSFWLDIQATSTKTP